jgi:YesN/AraC family two-component response regulator
MFEIVNYVQRIATPEWRIAESCIDFHDLTFIFKGEAVYSINGRPHKVSAGTVVYIPPGKIRSAYTFPENTMHSFALNICTQDTSMLEFKPIQHVGLDEQLVSLYQEFDKVWLARDEYFEIKANSYLNLILCRINELKSQNNPSDMRVERCKEYILTNYYKNINMKALAEMAGLNEVYFGALFKKHTGQSVKQYINSIRVNKAKDLLADGNSVADTSHMCGFDNMFYFSNVFKKITGKSPINYKK